MPRALSTPAYVLCRAAYLGDDFASDEEELDYDEEEDTHSLAGTEQQARLATVTESGPPAETNTPAPPLDAPPSPAR